jgi:hypothetical protein
MKKVERVVVVHDGRLSLVQSQNERCVCQRIESIGQVTGTCIAGFYLKSVILNEADREQMANRSSGPCRRMLLGQRY